MARHRADLHLKSNRFQLTNNQCGWLLQKKKENPHKNIQQKSIIIQILLLHLTETNKWSMINRLCWSIVLRGSKLLEQSNI